jgi:hypothetical protein
MEQSGPANPTSTAARTDLELQATGPRFARAFEKACLRDLEARRHDAWQARSDAAELRAAELRAERNARLESLDREVEELRRARELELGAWREPWIDAREQTCAARRLMDDSLKADRVQHGPDEHAELERLRLEHQRALDAFDEEARELDRREGLAALALRSAWNEARGRVLETKSDLRRAEREQRQAAQTGRASDEPCAVARAAAREANLAYAEALALWRRTERAGTATAAELVNLHHHAAELREQAQELELAAQELEAAAQAAADALPQEATRPVGDEIDRLRDAYEEARGQVAAENTRARAAIRDRKAARKDELQRARADLVARRRAEGEAYAAAVQAVYRARGLREAELRADWIDKSAQERAALATSRGQERAHAAQTRPELAGRLEQIRADKNAARDDYHRQVNDLWRDRDLARAEEREAARQAAAQTLARWREGR